MIRLRCPLQFACAEARRRLRGQRQFQLFQDQFLRFFRLGRCLDLLDPVNVAALKAFHDKTRSKWNVAGLEIPRNGNPHKKVNCAIFNLLYDRSDAAIETARAVCVPTQSAKRAWKRSWIHEEAHIQIRAPKA